MEDKHLRLDQSRHMQPPLTIWSSQKGWNRRFDPNENLLMTTSGSQLTYNRDHRAAGTSRPATTSNNWILVPVVSVFMLECSVAGGSKIPHDKETKFHPVSPWLFRRIVDILQLHYTTCYPIKRGRAPLATANESKEKLHELRFAIFCSTFSVWYRGTIS